MENFDFTSAWAGMAGVTVHGSENVAVSKSYVWVWVIVIAIVVIALGVIAYENAEKAKSKSY